MTNESISTQITLTSNAVDVAIHDPRNEAIATFTDLAEQQQQQLVQEAWFIGLRAVTNAHRLADEARLGDIGKSLLEDVDRQLRSHAERQEQQIQHALGRYFDPESGQLGERLRQLTGEDGTLVHLLHRHLGPQNSVLVETLVRHVGEQSPLFRKLSLTDSDGLLQLMSERLRNVIAEQHGEFQKALDPLCEEGAVGRFITSLRTELKRAEDDQAAQLKVALAALDTTCEDSLLNQLRRETQSAREQLLRAINPAAEGSPLAIIQRSLTERLESHAKSQKEQLEDARQLTVDFQRDVRDAVQRIEARRSEDKRSQRGGRVFEDAVLDFVQQMLGEGGYVVENTSDVAGIRPNCKVGDGVIHFPSDHGFYGARVVLEAKRDKKYTVSNALEELATARKNRDACAGVFIMAKSHALGGFPTFRRYGQDILVTWDDENTATDPYLQGAIMVGLALALRNRKSADTGDIQALQAIEQRLVKELERLEKIGDAAKKIRSQVAVIESEVEKGGKSLQRVIQNAKKTLIALNVELRDEAEERDAPIGVELTAPANDANVLAAETWDVQGP